MLNLRKKDYEWCYSDYSTNKTILLMCASSGTQRTCSNIDGKKKLYTL